MTNLSLYEIATDYQMAAAQLADMDLDDQCVQDTLESLSGDLQQKCTNVAKFLLNTESAAANIEAAATVMLNRAAAIRKRAERVREYLKTSMDRCGIDKIECPYFVLTIKKNPPKVEVYDEGAIPSAYWKEQPPPPAVLDKALIKQVLTVGTKKIEGARLVQATRLEIK